MDRPAAPAAFVLRLTATPARPWLGQRVAFVGQLVDGKGAAIPGVPVTLIGTAGILVGRTADGDLQRGSCVTLTTDPAGLVRPQLHPALPVPLPDEAQAAFDAELSLLPDGAAPSATVPALGAFAERYRAESNGGLRTAVDALFEAYPTPAQPPLDAWTLETAGIVAFATADGAVPAPVGLMSLPFRNWLGAWRSALRGLIEGDTRMDDLLAAVDARGAAGSDLATSLIGAAQAFAGLEHGRIGADERNRATAGPLNRFLAGAVGGAGEDALEIAVQAAGGVSTAIAASGAKAVQGAQSVQSVGINVAADRLVTAATAKFDGRLTSLEGKAVVKADLDGLRADVLSQATQKITAVDGRLATLEGKAVVKADLDGLRTDVLNQTKQTIGAVDGRLTVLEGKAVVKADLDGLRTDVLNQTKQTIGAVDGRLTALEGKAVVKADLDGLRADVLNQTKQTIGAVDGRLTALEGKAVVKADLDGLRADVLNQATQKITAVDSRLAALEGKAVTRSDFDSLRADVQKSLKTTHDELSGRIDANQVTVSKLNDRFSTLDVSHNVAGGHVGPVGPLGPAGGHGPP